ncbi:MAG TPA: hypothetical protein DEB10_04975 [Ruminococcaceae bacterium]|jgi:hypothetical protein|nr:hypothetical protein [Oscillospiraceae bacterium]
MKVSPLDKRVLNKFYAFLGAISVITSIVFLFADIEDKDKPIAGIVALGAIILVYIGIWIHANVRRSIRLKINNSEIEVYFGDIFEDSAELKAISFNEYFDTQVDDKIISKRSLHGQFIEKLYAGRVDALDDIIAADEHLPEMIAGENPTRPAGKKTKYKLGTVCMAEECLLIALSRFDANNKAFLEISDYISCLLAFWNEVDSVYNERTLALPVLGSGITRFRDYESISDQELLELIIWTFKLSRIKFTYPSKVKIVVWEKKSEKINLQKLKDLET